MKLRGMGEVRPVPGANISAETSQYTASDENLEKASEKPPSTAFDDSPAAASLNPVSDNVSISINSRLQSPQRPLSEDRDSAFWDDQDPDTNSFESDIPPKSEATEASTVTQTVTIEGSINAKNVQPARNMQTSGNTRYYEVNDTVKLDSLSDISQQKSDSDCIVDNRNPNVKELAIAKSRNDLNSTKTVHQSNIAIAKTDKHSNTENLESTLASDDQSPTIAYTKINSSSQRGKLSNHYPIQAKDKSHIATDRSEQFEVPLIQNSKTDTREPLFEHAQYSFIFDTHRDYKDRFDDVYVYKLTDDWSRETSIDVTHGRSRGDEDTKQTDEQSLSQATSELFNDSPNEMPIKVCFVGHHLAIICSASVDSSISEYILNSVLSIS